VADAESLIDSWTLHQTSDDPASVPGKRKARTVDIRDDGGGNYRAIQHCAAHFVCRIPAETFEGGAVEEDIESSPSEEPSLRERILECDLRYLRI